MGCAPTSEQDLPDWEALKHETPEWFKDAKFGIYFHWGVYTVPAYHSEWYSRSMYVPGSKANEYHLEQFGPLNEFGYKDFVPMFKAEKFDADAWTDLFVEAGARFAGPVAEHADGFSMWDSQVNSWNAKDRGPRIDVVGAMEEAIRKRGLKFITTFHHQWQWGWYPTFKDTQEVDAGNPGYSELYGPVASEAAWRHKDDAPKPDDDFSIRWAEKVKEVVNNYNPDMIYFDTRLGHMDESYRKDVVNSFRENNRKRGMAGQGVILHKDDDLPANVSVRNYEKSRMNKIGKQVWQTEETITDFSWCYTKNMELRSPENILHALIDVVSKNGVYLLNISPKSDGTIPQDQKLILRQIGAWMNKNGEAIYGTRPWYTYGEGPQKEADESQKNEDKEFFELQYTGKDIRYTKKGNTIYAILMGQPEEQEILLESFDKDKVPGQIVITDVTLIGSNNNIAYEYSEEGLRVTLPDPLTRTMATVLKIRTGTVNSNQ